MPTSTRHQQLLLIAALKALMILKGVHCHDQSVLRSETMKSALFSWLLQSEYQNEAAYRTATAIYIFWWNFLVTTSTTTCHWTVLLYVPESSYGSLNICSNLWLEYTNIMRLNICTIIFWHIHLTHVTWSKHIYWSNTHALHFSMIIYRMAKMKSGESP